MRSRWLKSVNGLAVLLLFGVGVAEQGSAHPCPFHDGALAALVAESGAATDHGASQAPAGHEHHAQQAPNGDQPQQADDKATCCTCVGDCTTPALSAIIAAPLATVAIAEPSVDAPLPQDARIAVISPPFVLPFANGPPAMARIA